MYYVCSSNTYNIIIALSLENTPIALGFRLFFIAFIVQAIVHLDLFNVDGSTFFYIVLASTVYKIYHRHPYFNACT